MLSRLEDIEASSRRSFKENNFIHFEVYASGECVGHVRDVLVDEVGHFQYLVVELSDKIATKQILIPEGAFQVERMTRRIYASNLNQAPVANNVADCNITDKTINASGK